MRSSRKRVPFSFHIADHDWTRLTHNESAGFSLEYLMKKPVVDAAELLVSPMRHVTLLLPQVLLDHIDAAAKRDDPSCPNRSSWIRRSMIAALRREAA